MLKNSESNGTKEIEGNHPRTEIRAAPISNAIPAPFPSPTDHHSMDVPFLLLYIGKTAFCHL